MFKFRLPFFAVTLLSLLALLLSVPSRAVAQPPDASAESRSLGLEEHATRILLLGKDRAASLADSILILSLSEADGDLRILQIPRDTYAAYTDRDYRKLNGAYSALGMQGFKQFLSQSLGVSVDYVLTLDLDCVSALVDAVGGVELDIPQDMIYSDPAQDLSIRLSAGHQHLNGQEAEQFLRFRSGYADADLGRLNAQKQFLAAYVEKCKSIGVMELLQIVWKVLPNAETDLPIGEAIRLVRLLPRIEPEKIPMLTAPGEAVQGNSGAWYYVLNRAGMIRAINEYMLPSTEVTDALFDPARVFDRAETADFHKIYTAPDVMSGEVPSILYPKERNLQYGRNDQSVYAVSCECNPRRAGTCNL